MMTDWESDPILKALRNEFIDSLNARFQKLKKIELEISSLGVTEERLYSCQMIAHNIAGSAETYGFPVLTQVAAHLEDFLEYFSKQTPIVETLKFIGFFGDTLDSASKSRLDPIQILEEDQMKELIFVVGFLPD